MSSAVADALKRHEHVVQDVPEGDLPPTAPPHEVLRFAHAKQLDVMTNDPALQAAALAPEFAFGRSIVYLQLPGDAVEQDDAIDRLFTRFKRLTPGRLYTVTESRVKIRQLPSNR
jgi:hypothetical protein